MSTSSEPSLPGRQVLSPAQLSKVFADALSMEYRQLAEVALSVAVETARHIQSARQEIDNLAGTVNTKSSETDPVTAVDKSAENKVHELIAALRPDDSVFGEENGGDITSAGVVWVLDPIDGTVNFLYGLPAYSISLGAQLGGETVVGVVVDIARDLTYLAVQGAGAFVAANVVSQSGDGARIVLGESEDKTIAKLAVTTCASLDKALVATGFGYTASRREKQGQLVAHMLPAVRDIRRMGSAALDLCAVAAGYVDAHYEHGLNVWDYCAGALIAREAGARIQIPARESSGSAGELVLVAAPGVFDALHDELGRFDGLAPISAH